MVLLQKFWPFYIFNYSRKVGVTRPENWKEQLQVTKTGTLKPALVIPEPHAMLMSLPQSAHNGLNTTFD